MKLSVSLPEEDVEFLDDFVRNQGYASRSAAVHKAVRLLRSATLETAYAEAWTEWSDSEDAEVWGSVVGDGLAQP